MSIGRKLRRLREDYEVKNGGENMLSYIAQDVLGVENYVLLNYESIKVNPPVEALEKLAKFYGVSLDYLLEEDKVDSSVMIDNKPLDELIITFGVEVLNRDEKEVFFEAGIKAVEEYRKCQN